jgi:hypothetical protein
VDKRLDDLHDQSERGAKGRISYLPEFRHWIFYRPVRNLVAVPNELSGKTILMDDYSKPKQSH